MYEKDFNLIVLLLKWKKDLEKIIGDLKGRPIKKSFVQIREESYYVMERLDKSKRIQKSVDLIQEIFECNGPYDGETEGAYQFLFTNIGSLLTQIEQISQESK